MLAPLLAATLAAAAPLPNHAPDAAADRARIPDVYKWNLSPLVDGEKAFEEGLAQAARLRERLAARGKLAEPRALADALAVYFEARLLTNKLTLWANLRQHTALRDAAAQDRNDRALDAMSKLMTLSANLRDEVLALDDAALARANVAEPRLAGYRPYLDGLRRRRARVLPPEAERVLSLAGDNLWAEIDLNELPSDHEKAFKALRADLALPPVHDETGKQVALSFSRFGALRASPDRKVRQEATDAVLGTLRRYQDAFAATFAGQMNLDVMLARARHYPTALEAYLDKDEIDPAVYRNLVSAVRSNLAPLHRYVSLRKKVMKLDKVRYFDLYPPITPGASQKVPYAEAQRILPEALAPLGPEYGRVLRQGLDPRSGWLDLYPHQDKDSGASCSFVHGVHPFVFMNYQDDVDDLSTLAHEFGHALHSWLAGQAQPYVTSGYVPFVAEIASTVNEKLLSDHLMRHARSDGERLVLLSELADKIRTTIYRQTLFAEFELRAHEAAEKGTPLNAGWLNRTYGELVRAWYGPDFEVGPDDEVEWAMVPHFYYKYYMFSYATGLSAGIALAERIEKQGAPARDAYLGMLRGGSSRPPLDLLRGAGVDLTRPEAVEAAARLLDRTVSEMERLLAGKGSSR
ncbi:MAG: oligoendopeptidase F family protein [Deltaproteobacteria bacterium]|nr:oligoendopeptidase F family protein [Deltaproteobacteria bacterium]